MSPHRAVIEAGPGAIRRLCCGADVVADTAVSAAALAAIDDQVALLDERPVAVDSLWFDALRSVAVDHRDGPVVVHPSWWSAARVEVVTAAARTLTRDVVVHPRSWLLRQASSGVSAATVVVEIAERLVLVAGAEVAAVARRTDAESVAGQVGSVIARMTRGITVVVLIDVPSTVAGAAALAAAIAGAVRGTGSSVVEIDGVRLARLARAALPPSDEPADPAARPATRSRVPTLARVAAAGVALALLAPAAVVRHGATTLQRPPTTLLVEGRVALTIPADWSTQRVVSGPGSARVQVTSPADPEVALHVTQSPVPGETLPGTAQRLKRAIDASPAGVFVDFNPSDIRAGRPAVTYREVRAGHQVRWTICSTERSGSASAARAGPAMKTSSGRCVRKPYGPSTPLVEPGRIGGNQTRLAAVLLDVSTPNTLNADFDLMRSVAGITDARNEEIRAMLQAFIGRMSGVPPSVWGGLAAARFQDVVDRWNAESTRLYHVLHAIADTIRHNEAALREAGQIHARHIAAAGGDL